VSLKGIRVIEIGQVLSAPYAGMILSDLGAEVIKIEKPINGDDARSMGPAFRDNASMTFHDVNRGKRSVIIDLKSPEGLNQLFLLLQNADVLIHNLRPGEAEKLGFGADQIAEAFPRLVYCEITAFGHKGPRRLQPGYEPLLQAFSGLISMNGSEDSPPARMGASIVDQGSVGSDWNLDIAA
jgi:formyl-CoA transferase